MLVKEHVKRELEHLNDAQLQQVAEYIAFLKLRTRLLVPTIDDEAEVAALYREFADEDRALADEGIAAYAGGLSAEDTR